jgi:hypothetical protein
LEQFVNARRMTRAATVETLERRTLMAADTSPPTATLNAPPAAADLQYTFSVSYADDTAIDPATLDLLKLQVKETRRFPSDAYYRDVIGTIQVLSKSQAADGSWVVTYRMTQDYGERLFHDGTYAVITPPWGSPTIGDTSGNRLSYGEIGRFDVVLPKGGADVMLSDLKVSLPRLAWPGSRGRASVRLWGKVGILEEDPPAVKLPPVDVAFYLVGGPEPSDGILVARRPAQQLVSRAKARKVSIPFAVPADAKPGWYSLTAVVDDEGALVEPDEMNNRLTDDRFEVPDRYVDLSLKPKPPERAQRGGVTSLLVKLINDGSVPARGTVKVHVAMYQPREADGAALGEPLRTAKVFRIRLAEHLPGRWTERSATLVRVPLPVPKDWRAGRAYIEVTIEPDASLAALERHRWYSDTVSILID